MGKVPSGPRSGPTAPSAMRQSSSTMVQGTNTCHRRARLDGTLSPQGDILKIWPEREPVRRLRQDEFNPVLDELMTKHCG